MRRLAGWPAFILLTFLLLQSGLAEAARRSVRFVTFNVWGLPSPILVKPSRLKIIAEHIPKLEADVIAFQEAFTAKARPLAEMPEYPYLAFGPPRGKGAQQSSGVLIASRWPIVETGNTRFSECSSFDCFANKGAVYARVRIDGLGDVDVFTTHMNAGSNDWIRVSQVHELGALIRERHDDSRPLIVLGDFNIRPESLSYDLMTQLLGLRDSHKEFREAHPGLSPIDWDGYTIDPRRNGNIKIAKPFVKPHRIDYVWLQDGPGHRTTIDDSRLVLDEKIEGKFLSDHFGVQADLTIDTAYPVE